jgi:3-oxo-5-alpha-steroid 4-dehydrogenase 1
MSADSPAYRMALAVWLALGLLAFAVSLRVKAPYGRHQRPGWGPAIPNNLAWFLMELPALLVFNLVLFSGEGPRSSTGALIASLYSLHYAYRALIYPWMLRTRGKAMPLSVAGMAVIFNSVNGALLGTGLKALSYSPEWLLDPRFLGGAALFAAGMFTHLWADRYLISLRKSSDQGYRIPNGGLFRYVSCPNHLGEMLQWTGFALLTWSGAAAVFAAWTVLNVLPRSLAHHRWYMEHFPDYPSRRKALVPGLL